MHLAVYATSKNLMNRDKYYSFILFYYLTFTMLIIAGDLIAIIQIKSLRDIRAEKESAGGSEEGESQEDEEEAESKGTALSRRSWKRQERAIYKPPTLNSQGNRTIATFYGKKVQICDMIKRNEFMVNLHGFSAF